MNQLIKIETRQIGEATINSVNARDLHAFLEVKTEFKNWIARRIEDYDFTEGKDFGSFLTESTGGRPAKEYALTIDMAKEISMVERNEKGKEARAYFIECERRAHQTTLNPSNLSRLQILTMAMEAEQKVQELSEQVGALQPKADALDRIATADGSTCITDAAKTLQVRPKDLFQWLQSHEWIYRRPGGRGWLAYQNRIQQGLLEHKVTTVQRGDGSEKVVENVLVTPKGLARLAEAS